MQIGIQKEKPHVWAINCKGEKRRELLERIITLTEPTIPILILRPSALDHTKRHHLNWDSGVTAFWVIPFLSEFPQYLLLNIYFKATSSGLSLPC